MFIQWHTLSSKYQKENKTLSLIIIGGSKYRKGGQYIVMIFWPRGQNIVGVKISSHTGNIYVKSSWHQTERITLLQMYSALKHMDTYMYQWVVNECCCPRTVNISNVNFTLKNIYIARVSEWSNSTAFLGTADNEIHTVHICRVIVVYTLESLSSLTYTTHNLQARINFKKKKY